MKGYHAEEISTLNNEELDNLIITLVKEKSHRCEKEKEGFLAKLDNLIQEASKKGYKFYSYEGEPIDNIDKIEIH